MLANGKIHAGKQNTYTQLDIRNALWRVFRACGRCGVRDYREQRLPGEISADGILYRCRGRWNWLLASFGIPTQRVGRPIRRSRGVSASNPLASRRYVRREQAQAVKLREGPCLKCGTWQVSVHFTCDACRSANSAASAGGYL